MPETATANLERRAEFFKALGHPVRLLILNLVQARPRHGEELALILMLNQATISHHLGLLVNAGLLTCTKRPVLPDLLPGARRAAENAPRDSLFPPGRHARTGRRRCLP